MYGIVEELDWYRLSHEIQKFLPTILIGAQQPVYLNGFGGIESSRIQFKKVTFSKLWSLYEIIFVCWKTEILAFFLNTLQILNSKISLIFL